MRILSILGRNSWVMVQHQYNVPRITKTATDAKKKTLRSSQCATERVQKLRCEYWEQVKQIAPENLVFLDEMGVELGLTRTQARSPQGSRVYALKPFYRGAQVTVLGAVSLSLVVSVMTLNGAMDGDAFTIFIEKFLVPRVLDWCGGCHGQSSCPQDSCD